MAEEQTVTDGQTLASLDTGTLQQADTSARITLDAAGAKLSEDEAAQSASTTSPTHTTTTPNTGGLPGTGQGPISVRRTVFGP
jgi:multidrug efflux pump subunit AcrA (membrane-fusion protein)